MSYVFIIHPTCVTFPTKLTFLDDFNQIHLTILGMGIKRENVRTNKKGFHITSLRFARYAKKMHKYCSLTCRKPKRMHMDLGYIGRQCTLAVRFRTPCYKILSEQSIRISCLSRLLNVSLKTNETPSRADSIQQTLLGARYWLHYCTRVPNFTFALAFQTTPWFIEPFLSIRL